jgi:predicted small metal-binding protein
VSGADQERVGFDEGEGDAMAKFILCDCGVVVRGDTDDEFVANAQAHARTVHNMEITREQALGMAQPE